MTEFINPNNVVDTTIFLSRTHFIALAFGTILIGILYISRNTHILKQYGRWVILITLIMAELSLNYWYYHTSVWDIKYTLPLQLCSISLYLCCYMIITKQKFVFEVVYFLGIGGATQALLTPELFYDFPHFRFMQFFIAHIAIIISILYMIWVEKYRIYFSSIWKAYVSLQVIALLVFFLNRWSGGNYMFLANKPLNPSLIDFLGPYPWYILSLEVVVLLIFFILYLPFGIKAKKHRKVKEVV